MKARLLITGLFIAMVAGSFAQQNMQPVAALYTKNDTSAVRSVTALNHDSGYMVNLNDVTVVSFKTKEEWMTYWKYKSRIQTVMPYVKIAKQLYAELKDEKATVKKRDYKHYRKDLEDEMKAKFEKELKNLTVSQGQMLFKLLNRETGNNGYTIIKEVKGPATAWFYQLVGKRYGYDLKEKYDPEKEKMIELIIKQLGPDYKI